METIRQIIEMIFPAGIGTAIGWLLSRKVYFAKNEAQIHDIYKKMYDDVATTLTKMQDENKKLYKAIARLERAVNRATSCRLWPDCPIAGELQEQQAAGSDTGDSNKRQCGGKRSKGDSAGSGAGSVDTGSDDGGSIEEAPRRGNIDLLHWPGDRDGDKGKE